MYIWRYFAARPDSSPLKEGASLSFGAKMFWVCLGDCCAGAMTATTTRAVIRRCMRGSSFTGASPNPARGFRGSQGEWLHSIIIDLIWHEETGYGVSGDDASMLAAHERAIAELPGMKQHFQSGLAVGERMAVKYGFPVDGNQNGAGDREYMWVMVSTWQDGIVHGQLANESRHRPDLIPGHAVELQESEIYDWLLYLPGGEMQGGYTNLGR